MNNELQSPEEKPEEQSQITPNMSPVKAAILGLIVVFLIFQLGGGILAVAIFGFDINSANMNLLRLLTIGTQILFILYPAILLSKLVYENVASVLRLKMPNPKEVGLLAVGMIVLIPLLQEYLHIQNYIITKFAESNLFVKGIKDFLDTLDKYVEQSYTQILTGNNIFEMVLIVITVAITPAICEEFFFRGFVQKSFEFKLKPLWAIFLTAAFFGLYHFNPYGLLPLIVIGMYLGFAVYISDSIIVSVVLHFLNNFISIMAFFIFGKEELMQSNFVDIEGIDTHLISFLLLLALFVAFVIFAKKNYIKLTKKEVQNDLS
jgi:membrane protease YdiL (CAAX protease family)